VRIPVMQCTSGGMDRRAQLLMRNPESSSSAEAADLPAWRRLPARQTFTQQDPRRESARVA